MGFLTWGRSHHAHSLSLEYPLLLLLDLPEGLVLLVHVLSHREGYGRIDHYHHDHPADHTYYDFIVNPCGRQLGELLHASSCINVAEVVLVLMDRGIRYGVWPGYKVWGVARI